MGPTAAAPDWYEDPLGRHQYRYWDGAAWTQNVADSGQTSVDPLDAAGGAPARDATEERFLLVLPMSTDVAWGGYQTLHFTDRRLIVEKVMSSATGAAAVMAAGLAGAAVASDHARDKSQQALGQYRSPDEILRTAPGSYAIDYDSIKSLRLARKALPIGYSRCKIESSVKNATLAFKREYFDSLGREMGSEIMYKPFFWMPNDPYVYLVGIACCVDGPVHFFTGMNLARLNLDTGEFSVQIAGWKMHYFAFSDSGKYLLDGWQASTIMTFQSGFPASSLEPTATNRPAS